MGKVRLLMPRSAVVTAFGPPAWCLELSAGTVDCDWFAPPDRKITGLPEPLHTIGAVSVRFWKGKVVEIHLMAPDRARPEYRTIPLLSSWRTSKGIGLGRAPPA